mgnify:FL=1
MKQISTYNDEILIEGCEYSVGTNDGKEFSKVAFSGYKKLYGKTMLSFTTNKDKQITINPSYMSFAIEEETEMNPVTYRQSTEKE